MDAAYKDFQFFSKTEAKGHGTPNIKAFTRDKFHFPDNDSYPMGGWKASDTTLLLRWLLRFLEHGPNPTHVVPRTGDGPITVPRDPEHRFFVRAMHDAGSAALRALSVLHCGKLWHSRELGLEFVDSVQLFAAAYSALAKRSYDLKLCRFPMQPVVHAWQHYGLRTSEVLARGARRVLSPYAHMNDRNEDFLGHVSRISRRVSGRTTSLRTLQRYLIRYMVEWKDID